MEQVEGGVGKQRGEWRDPRQLPLGSAFGTQGPISAGKRKEAWSKLLAATPLPGDPGL